MKNQDDLLAGLGRFSEPALYILISLADGPKHGYAMTQDIEAVAGLKLGPGTLCGAIARLEEREWIEAWNAHDIDRILSHYRDDVRFVSPLAVRAGARHGAVRGRRALRDYFERGCLHGRRLRRQFHRHRHLRC